jgi:hypothetical protein
MRARRSVMAHCVAVSFLTISACSSSPDQTIEAGASTEVVDQPTEQLPNETDEFPSLLDFSNLGNGEVFLPYVLESPEQLRDSVSATIIGQLRGISEGYAPDENWGVFPGTFHAEFDVEVLLGGQQDPGDTVVVAIRLDRAPEDVDETLDVLREHLGETYLLFLTPEYARGTGDPTGNFVLAPEAPAPALLLTESGELQPISAAEELLREAIRRGEQLSGVDDPTADDPVDESQLAAELRQTFMGAILDYDIEALIKEFVAPIGKTVEEIGISGDPEYLRQKLERNAEPAKVEPRE